MPDLEEGKHYTADDMRRARAEGERRGARSPDDPGERDRPTKRNSDMIASDVSNAWSDPAFRRELITVAAKAAQVAVRNRDEAAKQLGADGTDEKQLLISEDRAKHMITVAVKQELVHAFSSVGLDIGDDAARLKTAMQLKRTFDLEENSTKLLKRIAWQAFVGFLGFLFVALGTWFGISRR